MLHTIGAEHRRSIHGSIICENVNLAEKEVYGKDIVRSCDDNETTAAGGGEEEGVEETRRERDTC